MRLVLAILKTRFRCGSLPSLTSPHAVTRWLILQKARRHTVRCSGRLRARGFRYCFTPLAGCFSPFPHGTGSLSVTGECLALEGGPPGFGPGFTCPALLGCRARRRSRVRVRGSHPLRPAFPCRSAPDPLCNCAGGRGPPGRAVPQPLVRHRPSAFRPHGFVLVRVRSPLLAQSRLISLPPGT